MKDGGPAFPHVAEALYYGLDGLTTRQITNNGMSLRDYFAATALQGYRSTREGGAMRPEEAAGLAYSDADAMLAEREKS